MKTTRRSVSSGEKIRVCYVVHLDLRWVAFEWIARELDRDRFELYVLFLNEGINPTTAHLEALGVHCEHIDHPYDTRLLRGTLRVLQSVPPVVRFCRAHRIDVLHAHFQQAPMIAALAGWWAGVPRRLYTRHVGAPHPWPPRSKQTLLFRKIHNRLSTRIIAITELVREALLAEQVPAEKIDLIHHGFDLEAFRQVSPERIEAVREKYIPGGAGPVIGNVSRYVEYKGIQYLIPAFLRLLEDRPNAFLVVAGTFGPDDDMIRPLVDALPPERVAKIRFEEDHYALFHLFDVFVHIPIDRIVEAYGQVYVEAMAAGVPSVISLSGIALEYAKHGENAWVVDYRNSEQVYEGIARLLEDHGLRAKLIEQGWTCAVDHYGLQKMIGALEDLYQAPGRP
ncbi:glycosyltransferase family 4 protein [Candidatus Entotheonella palauensis]|uniref:Glycosyltransferase subfamily 4-like N-terminal domain-containing protein n=1 Tax=Candidatus Entotheonella gemina TaxID=1429439 RepID=W4MA09_9BACT|nr:glycosyltransferase family 4 protein [Candidatus Entotheonella palauensis]ETX06736.1 MAG: hypothetical protein ETSY2_15340 [Candidatus Entotheonella gemina]